MPRKARNGGRPECEHKRPEKQGAFVRTPGCGDTVVQGKLRVGIAGDVQYGKIIRDKGIGQTEEGDGNGNKLPLTGRNGDGHPRRLAARSSDDGHRGLEASQKQRGDECELSNVCGAWHEFAYFVPGGM